MARIYIGDITVEIDAVNVFLNESGADVECVCKCGKECDCDDENDGAEDEGDEATWNFVEELRKAANDSKKTDAKNNDVKEKCKCGKDDCKCAEKEDDAADWRSAFDGDSDSNATSRLY